MKAMKNLGVGALVVTLMLVSRALQAQAITLTETTVTDSEILTHTHAVEGADVVRQLISIGAMAAIEVSSGVDSGTLFQEFDWVSYVRKTSEEFLNPKSEFLTALGGSAFIGRGNTLSYSHSFDPLLMQPPDEILEAYLLIDLSIVRENDEGLVEIGNSYQLSLDLSDNTQTFSNVFIDLGAIGSLAIDGTSDTLDITLTNLQDSGNAFVDTLAWNGSVFAYNVERGQVMDDPPSDDPIDPNQTTAVPEPATAAMSLLGLLGLGAATRRRRRA